MKKIIVCCLVLSVTLCGYSQQIDPTPTLTKQDYLKKSKQQRTTGWIMAGGGIGIALLSLSSATNPDNWLIPGILPDPANEDRFKKGSGFFLLGSAIVLGSVPLFIAAGKNKRKAAQLSVSTQNIRQLYTNRFASKAIPSLQLKIAL